MLISMLTAGVYYYDTKRWWIHDIPSFEVQLPTDFGSHAWICLFTPSYKLKLIAFTSPLRTTETLRSIINSKWRVRHSPVHSFRCPIETPQMLWSIIHSRFMHQNISLNNSLPSATYSDMVENVVGENDKGWRGEVTFAVSSGKMTIQETMPQIAPEMAYVHAPSI